MLSAQKIRDYHVLKKLGQNKEGGRVTYLAQSPDGQKVVIKEFQFLGDSKWEDYSAIAREVEILKTLDHPRIPKFIESFETDQGACLIQEYINAPNLDQKRTFTFEQIKQLGKDLLEMLVYLQSLNPPVLHRDIKPGNLLLDADLNLYLVDFGFSRIGLQDIAASSMVRGTTGFMPPEQFLGRELSKASDLYSVGATLVCLMLGISSGRMAELVDVGENRLKFSDRLVDADPRFLLWLERLTEPRVSDRFADAAAALEALDKALDKSIVKDQPRVTRADKLDSESIRVYQPGSEVSTIHQYGTHESRPTPTLDKIKARKIEFRLKREVEIARTRHQRNPSDAAFEYAYNKALDKHISFVNGGETTEEKESWLKHWHVYAGYFASVIAAVSGLYFSYLSSASPEKTSPAKSPVAECCTSNPCTSLQKWGCENGIPYP
jgi:serine/threonine protein kinase